MFERPHWWDWEMELSTHVEERMIDRSFTEVDLRTMIHDATDIEPTVEEGRWLVFTQLGDTRWKVVVEPVESEQLVIAITAFPI